MKLKRLFLPTHQRLIFKDKRFKARPHGPAYVRRPDQMSPHHSKDNQIQVKSLQHKVDTQKHAS